MPVKLAADALTSLQNARLYVRRGVDQTDADDLLTLLINSYSRAIRRYCDRQFLPVETALAKKFRYQGDGVLSLAPSELKTVSSLLLYSDLPAASQRTLAAQTTTAESEYRLEPRNGTAEGTYLWLVLPEIGAFNPYLHLTEPLARRRRVHEVTVTGDWGAGAVPADVESACLMAVADAFRNPEGFGSRAIGALSFAEVSEASEAPGRSLPPDARALLGPYRRSVYV